MLPAFESACARDRIQDAWIATTVRGKLPIDGVDRIDPSASGSRLDIVAVRVMRLVVRDGCDGICAERRREPRPELVAHWNETPDNLGTQTERLAAALPLPVFEPDSHSAHRSRSGHRPRATLPNARPVGGVLASLPCGISVPDDDLLRDAPISRRPLSPLPLRPAGATEVGEEHAHVDDGRAFMK